MRSLNGWLRRGTLAALIAAGAAAGGAGTVLVATRFSFDYGW